MPDVAADQMTTQSDRVELLHTLRSTMTSTQSHHLLGHALRAGARALHMDGFRAREVAPIVACAGAVRPMMALDAATAQTEALLEGDRDLVKVSARPSSVFAQLTFLGHGALKAHAARYGYDPSRWLESVVRVYAPSQVEGVVLVVEAGAGRRCLQGCVASLADAVRVAVIEAKTGESGFAQAAASWTGISLALYAIARSVET
jgi:hypothetical protein